MTRKRKKIRYRLHWASSEAPKPSLKWVIYDWTLIGPVAYLESRALGRKVCALLNAEAEGK
jgi:hypothetical protein